MAKTLSLPILPPLLTMAALLSPLQLPGQAAGQSLKPQILIVGTYHMGGSGDFIDARADDVLSSRRQREIEAVVTALSAFRPTKIAVEVTPAREASLNQQYRRYLAGESALARNEIDQIGFRLGKRLGHARLHGIDSRLDEDVGGVVRYAAQSGDTGFVNLVQRFAAKQKAAQDSMPSLPVSEILRRLNGPAYRAQESNYLRMALVGRDTAYVGADVVAERYRRNLRIFANLARIAEPGDRVLVIYGAGHGKLLRDFVRESGRFTLAPTERYLLPPGSRSHRR